MKRHCSLLMCLLVLDFLLLGSSSSAEVKAYKVADSKSFTNIQANSVYDTATVTVTIDPAVTNWIALSNSNNLVQLPTGDNNNIPFSGTPQINQANMDDNAVMTVAKGSAVSSAITLDDNDAYNCRIGNQAVISGSYPSVRAVDCVDWSKTPPVTHSANFAETGQLTDFFTANDAGDYTFKIDFKNKYTGAAAHGAVWLLMDVAEKVSTPIPLPDGQRLFSYQILGKAVTAVDPFDMVPIGADCCESGGNTLGFQISLGQFAGPTDMYLALYAPNLSPDIYVFDNRGNIAPLSRGLVPWKKSVSGPISEKLFSNFPVSQLPSGTYYLLIMITPENTPQFFHLWVTSLVAPGACVLGTVPDGSAGYVNGKVIAPNATVVYQGQGYDGQLSVSGNPLVGIIKSGQAYFYHPALGNAVLSEDNSRRAVGYFIAGVSVGSEAQLATAKVVSPLLSGQTVSLETGVDITRLGDGSIELANKTKRWLAVNTDAGTTMLVSPRDNFVETLALKLFINRILALEFWGFERVTVKANKTIETYGSMIRGARTRWKDPDVLQAYNKNKELFIRVNVADFVYFVGEGTKQIFGLLMPEQCLQSILLQLPISTFEMFMITLLDPNVSHKPVEFSDIFNSAEWSTWRDWAYEFAQDNVKCLTVVSTVPAPPVEAGLQLYYKWWDIVTFFQWGIDDMFGQMISQTFLVKAYDVLDISNNLPSPFSCAVTGDLTVKEQGSVTVTCGAAATPVKINLVSGVADLSGLGGPANLKLVPQQGLLTGQTMVTPPRSGNINVPVMGWDDQNRQGSAVPSITVKSESLSISSCTATGNLASHQQGQITVLCTTTGDVASVTVDLTTVGGPATFTLTDKGGGKWEGTTTVAPNNGGNASILVTATDKTGEQVTWNSGILVSGQLPSFPVTYAGTATMQATIFNLKGNASCTGTFDLEIELTTLGDVAWRTNWRFDPKVTYPASCTITRGVWSESIFAEWGTHDFLGNYTVGLFCKELKGTYDASTLWGSCSWSDSNSSGDVSFTLPRKQ